MTYIPAKGKLAAWRGGTFRHRFTMYTGLVNASPKRDFTDHTAVCVISDSGGTALKTLTTENGGITLGGVNGTIDLFISAADTVAFDWEEAIFDLKVTDTSTDDVDPLVYGDFTVEDKYE